MADGLTITMEAEAVLVALESLGDAAQPFVNAASRVSADAIDQEASGRLARQLSAAATGKSVAAIKSEPAYDGNGYVVSATDREPMPNLPLWLEKGTRPGRRPNRASTAPRPFFYVSAELEEGPHFRRIEQAVADCIDQKGLGD